jgi:Tfp pilus assembly protein PilZ
MGDVREELATEMDMLVKGLKIVTRCVTVDELVAAFAKFCTPTTCFIPTKDRRRIGIETLFSLRLADGTVAVRGLCVVRHVWMTGENPFGRTGIQVQVIRISDDTKDVYERMVARRAPQTVDAVETQRIESRAEMRTVEMPPALPELAEAANDCTIGEDSEPTERAQTEVDPPGIVPLVAPAEPFAPIADTAVDTAAPRGSIPTLLGMTPPDGAAPRYVAEEPRAVKLVSPVRKRWWSRVATAVRALLHWRPKRARPRKDREKIAALSRSSS